jgi:hypothetical protein
MRLKIKLKVMTMRLIKRHFIVFFTGPIWGGWSAKDGGGLYDFALVG